MVKLPHVRSEIPPDLRNFIDRTREAFIALERQGIVGAAAPPRFGRVVFPGGPTNGQALGLPQSPFNLTGTGTAAAAVLSWDAPTYVGHEETEVWRNTTDNVAAAALVGSTPGLVFTDVTPAPGTYYYWVRFVNRDRVPGPFNAVHGLQLVTRQLDHDTELHGHLGGGPDGRYHVTFEQLERLERRAFDGGAAASVYLPQQNVTGGFA